MNRRGGEAGQLRCGSGCWMRNEGKQLDPPKACQNRVGQERVTDWRGGGEGGLARLLVGLLVPFSSWFTWAHLVGLSWPWQAPGGGEESCKQHTMYRRD